MKLAFEGSRAELQKQVDIMNKNLQEALDRGDSIIQVCDLYKGTVFEDRYVGSDCGFLIRKE